MKRMPTNADSALEVVHRTYEAWGQHDPYYAVLTQDKFRGDRGNTDDFFKTGQREIAFLFDRLSAHGLEPAPGRALDFGCGIGRLTFALGDRFTHTTGVDIAQSMADAAAAHNQRPEGIDFVANQRADLSLFEPNTFDLVFSHITLQHIPPEATACYIPEFFRIAKPGGLVVFQLPGGEAIETGSLKHWFYNLRRRHIRRWRKRLAGTLPYEMHWMARARVEQLIESAGGTLIAADDRNRDPNGRPNYRYFCRA